MNGLCDCIIPFYNEGSRVLHVVESILKVPGVSKIIVVDDGSTSRITYKELQTKFPQTISIRLNTNTGKANAVREGLKRVNNPYVLLLDGDLTNIKTDELENAIQKITKNPHIDMIILRRVADVTSNVLGRLIISMSRQDIVTSGQRLLKSGDLREILQRVFGGYQLEVATNAYMMKHKKKVYWMPFSMYSPLSMQKWGWKDGVKRYIKSLQGYFKYHLVGKFLWQTLFFCRDEAP